MRLWDFATNTSAPIYDEDAEYLSLDDIRALADYEIIRFEPIRKANEYAIKVWLKGRRK